MACLAWIQRPRANQALIQEILVRSAGCSSSANNCFVIRVEVHPAYDGLLPFDRNLGEHIETRASVFAAFGVVGFGREQSVRPRFRRCDVAAMEFFDGGSERAGVATDF